MQQGVHSPPSDQVLQECREHLLLAMTLSSCECFIVQLRQQSKDDSKQGALMHVTVEGAQARLMVLPSDAATTQTALDFIAQMDPPSQGVPIRQVGLPPQARASSTCCCFFYAMGGVAACL